MAIRIPSKNIYSPINNPKVRDNAIDNITVGYNVVSPLNEFDKLVYVEESEIPSFSYVASKTEEDIGTITAPYIGSTTTIARAVAYVKVEPSYKTITSYIPIVKENHYISKLLTGLNKNKEPHISYTIEGYEISGTSSAKVDIGQGILVEDYAIYDLSHSDRVFGDKSQLAFPNFDEAFTQEAQAVGSVTQTVQASVEFDDETTTPIAQAEKETLNGVDYYKITIKYLQALRITRLSGSVSNLSTTIDYTLGLSGNYIEYYPTKIEISFYGNTIGISTQDGSVLVGGGRKPYKIDGNELMQNRHYLRDRYYKTILDYSNGKETATIRCEIDNYYDYDTNEVVIAPFNNQLLDIAKYNELWNATYENGKVSQESADTIATEEIVEINNYTSSNNAYIKNFDDEKYSDYSDGQSLTLTYYVDGEEKTLEGIVDWDEGTGGRLFLTPDNAWGLNLLYSDGTNKIWGMILLNSQFDDNGGFTGVGTGAGIYLLVIGKDTFTAPLISFKIKNALAFHLQGYENYPTIVFETRKFVRSSGRISFAFKKTSSFNYIRFKLNGKTIDTGISYDVSALENGKTYCFSVDVNIDGGQGKIYWENMMLNIGARARPYDAYAEKMTFNMYDEVIPMIMNYNGEDIPLSNNADGTPKVFKVLGLTFSSKGKVFQELSLQEC